MILADVAFRIAAHLNASDLVWLADDEQQAEMLARMVQALAPDHPVILVPSSDALPGDNTPPSPSNSGKRVTALRNLRHAQTIKPRRTIALVLSGEAAARRYPPPDAFDSAPPTLTAGDPIDVAAMAETLNELGYFEDDRVDEPGEIALRGDVIDIFPADAGGPARIDITEDVIVAIRAYDPVTQRTTDTIGCLEIGRAAEPEAGNAVSILEHLPPAFIAFAPKADSRRRRFVQLAADAIKRAGGTLDAIDDKIWGLALEGWTRIDLENNAAIPLPRFAEARSPLAALVKTLKPLLDEGRTLLLAGHVRDLRFLRPRITERLGRIFIEATEPGMLTAIISTSDSNAARAASKSKVTAHSIVKSETIRTGGPAFDPGTEAIALAMPCEAGFIDDRLVVVAAADILGSRALLNDEATAATPVWGSTAAEIRCGDVVIHEDHGVALVVGLEPAPLTVVRRAVPASTRPSPAHMLIADGAEGSATEMIALKFAKGGRRLVAVGEADRLWRYGADADAVTLDTLNGGSWERRRAAIAAAVAESAKGLARLATERENREAIMIAPDAAAYEKFAGGFPFNETADQARAINAVRDDLASGKPMDRLVVGDVGYGKTEIALRAAALTALAGHQVIIAAPTTVLVRQHLESFKKRFEGTDIRVASLSRLSSAAERKAVKAGLADSSIHIVVGTGAVMARGVTYKDLALVVIDEEQKFGTTDKAKLRGTGDTHLLTLSATPIPRTLQLALVGLQQISLITTPPARRQSIRTSVDSFDETRIRTALLREKSRGGQSLVVVPRIEDMPKLGQQLRRIVPDLALIEAHGKMPAADIDEAMVSFANGQGDILLATNIIEAGLDVPRANTMIVWRADRFGLAQLHQLRGRVGRGNRRGQVILLTESAGAISERTMKRLRMLAAFDRLGAGFDISAEDLDMRGGGDLLGETQAGHIKLIGTDLYQSMLNQALRTARGETVEHWKPELNLGATGTLPDSWIPETDIRLSLYVRLARIKEDAGLDAFEDELTDRFGALPPPAQLLLATARIRIASRTLGISRIDAGPAAIAITPREEFAVDAKAAGFVEKNNRLILNKATGNEDRIDQVQAVLDMLASKL